MKFLQLIIFVFGIYESHGYCGLGHPFRPTGSDGMPCTPQNLDCIRVFFLNTWNCIENEGLLPLLANVTEFDFPAPSSNMSTTAYHIEIKGIRTGRSLQLYDRVINSLLIATEFPHIDLHAQKVVVHRPGMRDITVTDFDIRFDYVLLLGSFLNTDVTMSRAVKCNIEKIHQPVFHHGTELTDEEFNDLFRELLKDADLMIEKLFVVRSASFMEYLIANNICRPSGFVNSSSNGCGPLGRESPTK